MANFVALDFGERRVGVALGSSESQLVSPLDTLVRRSDQTLISALIELADHHQAKQFVIGLPCLLDGSETEMAGRVRSFDEKLRKHSALPSTLVCETLTSRAARERIAAAGGRQGRTSRRTPPHRQVDSVAAQIIGEQFLAEQTDADPERRLDGLESFSMEPNA